MARRADYRRTARRGEVIFRTGGRPRRRRAGLPPPIAAGTVHIVRPEVTTAIGLSVGPDLFQPLRASPLSTHCGHSLNRETGPPVVEIVYLQPGERLPEPPMERPWLIVEAADDGRFYGTGYGRKPSGDEVFYVSSAESDTSLAAAITAATDWARERGVSRIWVQSTPQ